MLKQWLANKLQGPVYLDCYTSRKDVYDLAKIESATRFYPEWWKKLKNSFDATDANNTTLGDRIVPTMRYCVGFTSLFKRALCIPLWSDLRLTVGPVNSGFYKWIYSDRKSEAGVHPYEQRGEFAPDSHYQHLKLDCPWTVKCDGEVSFLFFDPVWTGEPNSSVITPPGILDFKYQHSININMLVARDPEDPKVIDLRYGTPLAFLVPMTDRRVVLRYHLVSQEEFEGFFTPPITFVNAYGTIKKKEQEQCPMKSK